MASAKIAIAMDKRLLASALIELVKFSGFP